METWLIALGIFAADAKIKKDIEEAPEGTLPQKALKGRITFCKSHNYGMMMNLMDRHPEQVKIITGAGALGVLLLYVFYLMPGSRFLLKVLAGITMGGAASNVWDHWKRGYVVDYLQFNRTPFRHIAFNISDFCIFIGTAGVTICTLLSDQ